MRSYKLLPFLLLSSTLIGCGQPGPLYLPGQPAPIHVGSEYAPEPEAKPEKAK